MKQERRELKGEIDQKNKKILELEHLITDSKHRSSHMVMNFETKAVAINEVSSRNEILNESLDKVKVELFNARRTLTQVENEKFELEKEILRLRREVKHMEQSMQVVNEEKEHLIGMLELRNHILS